MELLMLMVAGALRRRRAGNVGEGGCVGDPVQEEMGIPYVVDGLGELGSQGP